MMVAQHALCDDHPTWVQQDPTMRRLHYYTLSPHFSSPTRGVRVALGTGDGGVGRGGDHQSGLNWTAPLWR